MSTQAHLLAGLLAYKRLWVLVASNHLFVLTLWYCLINLNCALLWALFMAHKCASVPLITENLLALLATLVLLMLWVIRVADTGTNMAAIQTELAGLLAASLWGLFEIISAAGLNLSIWVVLTTQGQSLAHLALLSQGVEDLTPQFDLTQHDAVANAVEAFLSARQSYTDTIGDV